MSQTAVQDNPFVLLMNPEIIIQAIERSDRLSALNSRICRPLDKPMIPKQEVSDVEAFDQEVDVEERDDQIA